MHLTGSDMKFARLTIVTAILFQNIWFPQRLLKLLGCRGQLILLAALILHAAAWHAGIDQGKYELNGNDWIKQQYPGTNFISGAAVVATTWNSGE